MKPWEQAVRAYKEDGSVVPFDRVLAAFLKQGFVWSSPDTFVLGKRVVKGAPLEEWLWGPDAGARADTWYVLLGAGKGGGAEQFVRLAPEPLEWVAWHRKGRQDLKFWKWKALMRRLRPAAAVEG